jgi:hypothetical protein
MTGLAQKFGLSVENLPGKQADPSPLFHPVPKQSGQNEKILCFKGQRGRAAHLSLTQNPFIPSSCYHVKDADSSPLPPDTSVTWFRMTRWPDLQGKRGRAVSYFALIANYLFRLAPLPVYLGFAEKLRQELAVNNPR